MLTEIIDLYGAKILGTLLVTLFGIFGKVFRGAEAQRRTFRPVGAAGGKENLCHRNGNAHPAGSSRGGIQ